MSSSGAMNRRSFLSALSLTCAAVLCGCGASPAPPSTANASAGASAAGSAQAQGSGSAWQQMVDAAKREGTVNLYGGNARDNQAMIPLFEKAFPSIKVAGTFAPGGDLVTRIVAERTAGKYLADVLIGPGASAIVPLKPIGGLRPMADLLIGPDMVDPSKWFDGHLWWLDAKEPYTTLAYQGTVQESVYYNTKMVDPKQFTSYKELLDPKWNGKIVATDVRKPGAGAVPTRFMYKHPDLGPDFLRNLFGSTNITLSSNQGQMIDWVAQGRYLLGMFPNPPEVLHAAEQGLPVAMMPGDQFKEGAPIGPGGGAVSLVDKGPHPNAAAVFVNWLLSREGQTFWQEQVQQNSLRIDIPKEGFPTSNIPKPGVKYVNAATEDYAQLSGTVITDLVTNAIDKKQ